MSPPNPTYHYEFDKALGTVRVKGKSIFIDIDPRWRDCADFDDLVTIHIFYFKPYGSRAVGDLLCPLGIDRGGRVHKLITASDVAWIAGRSFPQCIPFVARWRLMEWIKGHCSPCGQVAFPALPGNF